MVGLAYRVAMNAGLAGVSEILPASTVVPGRLQTAFDQTVTSSTSPITLYTVPAGHILYLDYLFLYCYAFTAGTGAAIGGQIVIDQGVTNFSCAIARFYKLQDAFVLQLPKPLIAATSLSLVALGPAGGGATFSVFGCIGADVI